MWIACAGNSATAQDLVKRVMSSSIMSQRIDPCVRPGSVSLQRGGQLTSHPPLPALMIHTITHTRDSLTNTFHVYMSCMYGCDVKID